MSIITVNNLTKSYDGITILNQIDFSLNTNEKVAIVGRNGAGKSTLAKIICGTESYDQGDIFYLSNTKLGYFSQHSFINSDDCVFKEMQKVFSTQIELKQEIEDMSNKLIDSTDEDLLKTYNNLLLKFEEMDGYTYEYKIETMLNRFGFKKYYDHPVNHLSGGQRTRLALAKLLLEEPDVLVLDEPTNHLDIETVEFLENFLKSYKKAIIIISHDRYFLNQVVNIVYEIEFKKGVRYIGNYDQYLKLKQDNFQHLNKQYELQQKYIKKEQEFIEKNIVRASTTKRAQSRRKQLEKLEVIDNPRMDDKSIKVSFDFTKNTGNLVLDVSELSVGYDKPLVKNVSFQIIKNEKVAILGPNGIGKSTLLKTINKTIEPLEGSIKYGANVEIAYFDQEMAALTSNKTVLDEIWDENRMMLEKDIRKILGTFLFTQEDVFKIVSDLSGGEKVRLAIAKLLLKKANFLVLDEITNHLDIDSREVLENALIEFPGTILFVSHDRFFINKIATKIIEINNESITEYIGDYAYYIEKRNQFKEQSSKKYENENNKQIPKKAIINKTKIKKEITQIEEEMENLESIINNLKEKQLKEEVYSDYEKAHEVQNQLSEHEKKLETYLSKWTELVEEIEE